MYVACTFIDTIIMPYGISSFLLTNNGWQFVNKFFNDLYGFLGVKQLTETAFSLQTKGQNK